MTDDLMERIEGCIANAEHDDEHGTLIDARDKINAQAAEIERLKNSVRFPTSEEEAVAMFIISERWLRENAPHRFKDNAAMIAVGEHLK